MFRFFIHNFCDMNLYLINGFLGSGKTTAIVKACTQLINQQIKTAVITNDQGEQQVDSAYVQGFSLKTGEISNGCFCCRFDALEQTVEALQVSEHPEIIFAESVGSCTDLVATVAKPFALNHYNVRIVISVFADAYFMHSIMKGTSCFIEESVQYRSGIRILQHQLIGFSFFSGRMCGKRITSLIDCLFVSNITKRSMPMPMPAAGGMP